MPRILQLVHGYPPRQNAGTEQYARRVAEGLRGRGWDVHTLAVAPEAGAHAYAVTETPGLTRVANNTPYAGLRRGESDPAVDAVIAGLLRRFRPDVVHVQHLQFLSTSFRTSVPLVWTLHDAWAWCAAGGLLLRDGQPCAGPGEACPRCASAWARDTPALTRALGAAGHLARFVDPPTLHAVWRRVPARLRARALAGPVPPLAAADLDRRDTALHAFAARCARILSPSRWLASAAVARGLPAPIVLPHGVDPGAPPPARAADAPFVFLGTLAPHKGPHLVRAAWQAAGVDVPLRIHGPAGPDAAYVAALPNDGPVPADGVPALLAGARALVLGSTWPENAPLVVLEARAAGCPVIAPAIGGLPELVEPGVDGWLYPPGDIAALAACLRAAVHTRPPVRPAPAFAAHLDGLEGIYAALGAVRPTGHDGRGRRGALGGR
jgi:glycosyltransferase involved in cell wall biosynthesis